MMRPLEQMTIAELEARLAKSERALRRAIIFRRCAPVLGIFAGAAFYFAARFVLIALHRDPDTIVARMWMGAAMLVLFFPTWAWAWRHRSSRRR